MEQYSIAQQINPADPYTYYVLGAVAQDSGQPPEKVLTHLLTAWRKAPLHSDWLYIRIGNAYRDMVDCGTAREWYQRGLKLFPGSPNIPVYLSRLDRAQQCN